MKRAKRGAKALHSPKKSTTKPRNNKGAKWQAQFKQIKPYVNFKKPKKVTPYFKSKVKKYHKLIHYYLSKPHIVYKPKPVKKGKNFKERKQREIKKLNKVKNFSNQTAKDLKVVFVHSAGIKKIKVKFDKKGNPFLDSPQIKVTKISFTLIEFVKAKNKQAFIDKVIKESGTVAKRFSLQVGIFTNDPIYTQEHIAEGIEAFIKGSPLNEDEKDAFQGLLGHEYKQKLTPMEYLINKKEKTKGYKNPLSKKRKKK